MQNSKCSTLAAFSTNNKQRHKKHFAYLLHRNTTKVKTKNGNNDREDKKITAVGVINRGGLNVASFDLLTRQSHYFPLPLPRFFKYQFLFCYLLLQCSRLSVLLCQL